MKLGADIEFPIDNKEKIPLSVEGDWQDGYEGDYYEPPRGAGLEDYRVLVTLSDGKEYDISELLDASIVDSIVEHAEESIQRNLRGW